MDMAERIADGEDSYYLSIPANSRKNLVQFVDVIRKLRVQAKNVGLPAFDPEFAS